MDEINGRPRRLRVSALAPVANPSYERHDTWNLLDDACRQLAAVHRAALDTENEQAQVRRLIDRLRGYERYWLFPGPARLAKYHKQLDDMKTDHLAEEVALAARLLAEYGDGTVLFDDTTPLAKQELVAHARQRRFHTVLLADDSSSLPQN